MRNYDHPIRFTNPPFQISVFVRCENYLLQTMIYNLYRFCGVESISQMISKYQRQTGQIFCDASLVSILPEGMITIPLLDVWEELDFTKEQKTKNN